MSSILEVLGMSLPYSSSTPALHPGKLDTQLFLDVNVNHMSMKIRHANASMLLYT
jgi:dihydroxyacid dehydratase/phosphogluconate dehydratase